MTVVSDAPWNGSASRYTLAQWRRACLIDHGGDRGSKSNFSLPVRQPDGQLNQHGLSAAAGRLDQVENITAAQRAAAARKLIELYALAGMTAPDHVREMASRGAGSSGNDSVDSLERCYTSGLVEVRSGGNGRQIGGYAAVFDHLSKPLPFGFERVGAHFFDESRRAGFPDVVARWNHDSFHLLGAVNSGTLRLAVDGRGLDYSVDLP